jgi:hypothetical protein
LETRFLAVDGLAQKLFGADLDWGSGLVLDPRRATRRLHDGGWSKVM